QLVNSQDFAQEFAYLDSLLDNGSPHQVTRILTSRLDDPRISIAYQAGAGYRLGRAHALLGHFPTAIRLLQSALESARSVSDTTTLFLSHVELARLYRSRQIDSLRFHQHVRQASSLANTNGNKTLVATATLWDGMALLARLNRAKSTDLRRWGYSEAALEHFARAALLYQQIGAPIKAAEARSRRGSVYERIGLSDSAIIYAQRHLREVEQLKAVGPKQRARIKLATSYLIRQDSASLCAALPLWRTSLAFARAHDLEYDERIILYNQGVNFWQLERYDSAYAYHLWYTEALEASAGQDKNAAIAELEIQYETEAKEIQLAHQAAELRRRQRNQLILGLGILLLTIGVFVLFLGNRTLRRTNQALADQQRENEVLRQEIDHRVKNNLQVMASMLQLGALRESGHAQNLLLANRRRILAMGHLHERLLNDQQNNGKVDIAAYLREICLQLRTLFPNGINLVVEVNTSTFIEGGKAAALGMILNEWLMNALLHAYPSGGPGSVQVVGEVLPQHSYRLCVADDGIGDSSTANGGFGSELVTLLSQKLNGIILVEERAGRRASIVFPL
ncbi:MAG: sensor histidine kinase, partial [Bacteroidota bacterium]